MSFIILDRDGVINFDSDVYIKSPAEWRPIPGSLEAIAKLHQAGFKIVIATNQSGVGRGLYDIPTLNLIHQKMHQLVQAAGGSIHDIFYCPHLPQLECLCRKPKPGLIYQIQEKYQLHLPDTFFIGDSTRDIEAARTAGCKPLLVLTGNGHAALKELKPNITYFDDLRGAVDYVINAKT